MGELEQSREAELVLNSVSDCVCCVSPDWTMRFMNRAGLAYFNVDAKAVLGRSVWEVFPATEGTQVGSVLKAAMESRKAVRAEMWGATRPNCWISVSAFPTEDGALAVIWRDETDRKRHDEAVEETLRRREDLYRELNHRIANGLQSVVGIVRLSTRAIGDPQSKAVVANAVDHIIALSLVHRRLYQSQSVETQEVREYLETLCRELNGAFQARAGPCRIVCDIEPDVYTNTETTLTVGLLLSELVMNSIKHGECARLDVIFGVDGGTAALQVVDDGKGFPPDFDRTLAKGVGLRLVSAWAKSLGGGITFAARNGGAKVVVAFPAEGHICRP